MKVLHALVLITAIASASQIAFAGEPHPTTIRSLDLAKPCRTWTSVRVTAYLNSSRHGALLSQSPGFGGKTLNFELGTSLDRTKNQEFFRHLWNPRVFMNSLFKASFVGSVSCSAKGFPTLIVEKVESIQISPLVDAR